MGPPFRARVQAREAAPGFQNLGVKGQSQGPRVTGDLSRLSTYAAINAASGLRCFKTGALGRIGIDANNGH
jgi:hypothetical protein